ncbi:MAG: DUF493 domain-containing protein [Campylobacteraceae bacterium]|nr:DUF493 domain-containing protein [Campylobacteraceae bacterium]
MNRLDDINSKELILNYPCFWTYKLITTKDADIEKILSLILKDREYNLNGSKTSKQGAYKSYALKLEVKSDDDRKKIFENLQKEEDIKFIL